MLEKMEIGSHATAAAVGTAVGFAAMGFLPAAAIALAAGGVVVTTDAFSRDRSDRGAVVRAFLTQPVRFEHAVVWCCSLVVAALLAKAWS